MPAAQYWFLWITTDLGPFGVYAECHWTRLPEWVTACLILRGLTLWEPFEAEEIRYEEWFVAMYG